MNVTTMNSTITREAAASALLEYKSARGSYDKQDWEIERIYRRIARGKTVISVHEAIFAAGFDERGRPRLAIARADDAECFCRVDTDRVTFDYKRGCSQRSFVVAWPGAKYGQARDLRAALPRIPPQYRPAQAALSKYHILWEADWVSIPRDPYLLKRIGKDAWVVLAAWDLTNIEVSVLRAHRLPQ